MFVVQVQKNPTMHKVGLLSKLCNVPEFEVVHALLYMEKPPQIKAPGLLARKC